MKKVLLGFLDVIEFFVSTAAVAILIYLLVTQPHQVNGSSMFPNFANGDFLLTDKLSYRFGEPQRGDVVVFAAPSAAHCPVGLNCDFIKRIIGLPGEQIAVQGGKIFINGQPLNEPYLDPALLTPPGAGTNSFLKEGVAKQVPADSYVVLGDNRTGSSDSREWGPVKQEKIVGKAWLRYWPPKSAGILAFEKAGY